MEANCRANVESSGEVWQSIIGYVRLNHFVAPWGRIYFVLDRSGSLNPFRRPDFQLLQFLRSGTIGAQPKTPQSHAAKRPETQLKLLAAGAAGTLVTLLRFGLWNARTGQSVLQKSDVGFQGPWSLLSTPLAAAAACAIFIGLAVWRREHPKAWLYAFVAGLALPGVFSQWLVG